MQTNERQQYNGCLIALLFIAFTILRCNATAAEVQLFNLAALGKPLTNNVILLAPAPQGVVAPSKVLVELNEGVIKSAIIQYSSSVTYDEVVKSVDAKYGKFRSRKLNQEVPVAIWQNPAERYSFMVGVEDGFVQFMVNHLPATMVPAPK